MTRTPLNDDELDVLLARGAGAGRFDTRTEAAIAALVLEARTRGPERARRRRRVGVALGAVAAALGVVGLLIAPTAISDWWLRTPPFQELPEGWLRSTEYIPIVWTSPDGEMERCRTYLELERADADLLAELDAAILARDWTGFGQELYDTLPGNPPATSVESEVLELSLPVVQEFAREVIPGLDTPDSGPAVGAFATTCRTDI